MQSFFYVSSFSTLLKIDFQTFHFQFLKAIEEVVPNFAGLSFIHAADGLDGRIASPRIRKAIQVYFASTTGEGGYHCCCDGSILLSIPSADCKTLAVIEGVDPYFYKNVAGDWLQQLSATLLEKFLPLKYSGIDLETGLPNAQHFKTTLQHMTGEAYPSVLLIEVYPRASSAREAKIHTIKVVRSLGGCVNGKVPLFYLGHDVFALINTDFEDTLLLKLGQSVLSWLRKDGFSRVHIGLRFKKKKEQDNQTEYRHSSVDEAWFALHIARKRGPFSLCDYDLLAHPERHPLCRPSPSLIAKLRRKWSLTDAFSLVQLQPADVADIGAVLNVFAAEDAIAEGDGVYVLHSLQEPQQSLNQATMLVKNAGIAGVKIGVAGFPQGKFSRSATVLNCRKALCHAAFFGDNGTAVFDSLSLNISGDMYYAEGDLTSAVREYKTGLECNPTDINLLNSLGVAYADMAKHKLAQICFKKALALDPRNYMALFNCGLGEASVGRSEEALSFFETAYANAPAEETIVRGDLQFQLGKLCCNTGRFARAAEILQAWYDDSDDGRKKGRALKFMGRAYYGLGRLKEAMRWLQRALRFDEFDAEAMGLLGLVYLLQHEGDEIALALCERSVDLDPDCGQLRLYLARVQIACGLYEESRLTLRNCVHRKSTRGQAQLLLGMSYQRQGMRGRARYWIGKILEKTGGDHDVYAQALKIKEELDEAKR